MRAGVGEASCLQRERCEVECLGESACCCVCGCEEARCGVHACVCDWVSVDECVQSFVRRTGARMGVMCGERCVSPRRCHGWHRWMVEPP